MANRNKEIDAEFYDLEYFISMEYRYFSGAHGSRVRNILSSIGEVKGLHCLDVGCGGGYLTYELYRRGADVIGIDYSKCAIEFAKTRFPNIDFRIISAYDLDIFSPESFDLVTLIDTIEHISDQHKVLSGVHKILKQKGRLVISTDIEGGPWSKFPLSWLIEKSQLLSADGRAYRLIKKVESYRKQIKNYHVSHVSPLSYEEIKKLLESEQFKIIKHRVYPLVSVTVRDSIFRLFPKVLRGDHQCIVAEIFKTF